MRNKSLFMLLSIVSLTARQTTRRCLFARAFTATSVTNRQRNFLNTRLTRTFVSTAQDEDLDAALDHLLEDAVVEAENPLHEGGSHMKQSRPMPSALVEEVCPT